LKKRGSFIGKNNIRTGTIFSSFAEPELQEAASFSLLEPE
jgi:hypothetical protein